MGAPTVGLGEEFRSPRSPPGSIAQQAERLGAPDPGEPSYITVPNRQGRTAIDFFEALSMIGKQLPDAVETMRKNLKQAVLHDLTARAGPRHRVTAAGRTYGGRSGAGISGISVDIWYVVGLFCLVIGLLALKFYDWPPNRDITAYATIAQELRYGEQLYVDMWDFKPPAIYVVYMIAQWLVESKPIQILLLHLLPTFVILVCLIKSGREAGFGNVAGLLSGLFWIALSHDLRLQMHEPNSEHFINAFVMLAFLQFLKLHGGSPIRVPIMIGTWFAIASLFKTVALAMAVVMGLAHLLAPPSDGKRSSAAKQVVIMAASGAICLAAVFGYFAVTGRLQIFWQVIVGAGPHYAAEGWESALDSFVRTSLAGRRIWLVMAVAVVPWIGVALLAWIDQDRRRSWVLLGAYAFSAAIAVALPGYFYAHYFQLLVPPLCLGFGWLATAFAKRGGAVLARGTPALVVLCLAVLIAFEARSYLMAAETGLRNVGTPRRGPLSGTYHQELYLETQELGRRLGGALHGDEILYQWGEESGLYWYSGKRPPATVSRWVLISGPQAGRLTQQTLKSLMTRPPDLVVAANRVLEQDRSHPVIEWIRSHYHSMRPIRPGERKFFTFFVPKDAPADLARRVGVDQVSSDTGK